MNRAVFLVDGFNLYHSVRAAARATGGSRTKWLNIGALCHSSVHVFGPGIRLVAVHYFSALATHLEPVNPGVTRRHRHLIRCLEDSGVVIHLARFKRKSVYCTRCGRTMTRREEKETDVAIAAALFETFHDNAADTVVIVSGDTDLAPAVRTASRLFPSKKIGFAFPDGRKNKELAKIADFSFTISKVQYRNHQFPSRYVLRSGETVVKPEHW